MKNRSESLKKETLFIIFLSSLRQRINDPLGVRKKKREQGNQYKINLSSNNS